MNQPKCKLCGNIEPSLDALRSHFRSKHPTYFQKVKAWLGPEETLESDDQLYTEPRERRDPRDFPWEWDSVSGGYRHKSFPDDDFN